MDRMMMMNLFPVIAASYTAQQFMAKDGQHQNVWENA